MCKHRAGPEGKCWERRDRGGRGRGKGKDVHIETNALLQILQIAMTSDNVWQRKRALQTCSQLLAACENLQVSKEPHLVPLAPSLLSAPELEGELCPAVHAASATAWGRHRQEKQGRAGAAYNFFPAFYFCREETPASTLAPW